MTTAKKTRSENFPVYSTQIGIKKKGDSFMSLWMKFLIVEYTSNHVII